MSGKGLSPALVTCETSQVLLVGVSICFFVVLPFSPHLPIDQSHMNWNNLEKDVKLNKNKEKEKPSL